MLCGLLVSSAARTAPPATAPGPDAVARCKTSLKEGRRLANKRDYKGALAAYQGCLALDPQNAAVLSEAGYAAYSDKDLQGAAALTGRAIAAAGDSNLKGASYYNLGLIAEARGDKPAAIAAYVSSLKARQHPAVRARLAKLDAAAAAAMDPFVPQPMAAPIATLAAYCKARGADNKKTAAEYNKDYDGAAPKMRCKCSPRAIQDGSLAKVPAPYLAVQVFTNRCDRGDGMDEVGLVDYILAVRTAAGFFTEPLASVESRHYCSESVEQIAIEAKDVIPGGAPEILIKWSQEYGCRSGETKSSTHMRVLGIGPSGKPSVTPTIGLATEETPEHEYGDSDSDEPTQKTVLEASFDAAGRLVLSNGRGARKHPDLGVHPLVFP